LNIDWSHKINDNCLNKMEYEYSDLKKAIYYFLTIHPNQKFTTTELYDGLKKEKICKDLEIYELSNPQSTWTHFIKSCRDMYAGYKNVTYNSSTDSYIIRAETSKYNMPEIENMIKYPQLYPDVRYDSLYTDGQTLLHILCSEGKNDLLEEIARSFHIDLSTKNQHGQSLVDVIPKTNDDTARMLLRITMSQMREISDGRILELKKLNTELQNANNKLFAQVHTEKHNITIYQARIYGLYVIIFVLIMFMLFVLF